MDAITENVQPPFRYMGRKLDRLTGLYYVHGRPTLWRRGDWMGGGSVIRVERDGSVVVEEEWQ